MFCLFCREQTLANGPASRGSGESAGGGTVLRSEHFDFPQPSDGDPLRGGIAMSNSHQSRSPMCRTFSRSSSGYFSVDSDSVPSSPLMPNISEAQDGQNDGKSPLEKKRLYFVVCKCKHDTDATNCEAS